MERGLGCSVEEWMYEFLTAGAKLVPVATVGGLVVKQPLQGSVLGLVGVATAMRLCVESKDGQARSSVVLGGGVGTVKSMVSEVSSLAFYVFLR